MTNKSSKIKVYTVIGMLFLVMLGSVVLIIKDEISSKRLRTNLAALVATVEEQMTSAANSPTMEPRTRINIVNTSTTNSTVKVNSNETSSNTKVNTYYVQPETQPIKQDEPIPYTETDEYKEWKEDFDKRWDEISKHNDEKQKELEESQEKFCEENPNLCD